jgi:hypothetical protein
MSILPSIVDIPEHLVPLFIQYGSRTHSRMTSHEPFISYANLHVIDKATKSQMQFPVFKPTPTLKPLILLTVPPSAMQAHDTQNAIKEKKEEKDPLNNTYAKPKK